MLKGLDPKDCVGDTPESALTLWLDAWASRNFRQMSELSQMTWRETTPKPVKLLKAWFGFKTPLEASIGPVRAARARSLAVLREDVAKDVGVTLTYRRGEEVFHVILRVRLIREVGVRKPSPDGIWGVNPLSALREETR